MNKFKEIYQYILGAVLVLGAFGIVGLIVTHEIPAGNKDAVMLCLGALVGGGAASVWNYFFGSSLGSSKKTDIMAGNGNGGSPQG
jgi:hypothetical protein